MRFLGLSALSFLPTMVALGVLGFAYADFALVWQPVPSWVPARELLAYDCAALMLIGASQYCGGARST